MNRRHVQQVAAGTQVEVEERPYVQQMERPQVEVTVWESVGERKRLLFEVTDPARDLVEPAGTMLGRVPHAVVEVLASLGYEVDGPQLPSNEG